MRLETQGAKAKFVYDTFQYVPVDGTLRSFLKNKQYVDGLLQSMRQECDLNVIGHYSDGQQFKLQQLFSDSNK
jgi:hypothetical protein